MDDANAETDRPERPPRDLSRGLASMVAWWPQGHWYRVPGVKAASPVSTRSWGRPCLPCSLDPSRKPTWNQGCM